MYGGTKTHCSSQASLCAYWSNARWSKTRQELFFPTTVLNLRHGKRMSKSYPYPDVVIFSSHVSQKLKCISAEIQFQSHSCLATTLHRNPPESPDREIQMKCYRHKQLQETSHRRWGGDKEMLLNSIYNYSKNKIIGPEVSWSFFKCCFNEIHKFRRCKWYSGRQTHRLTLMLQRAHTAYFYCSYSYLTFHPLKDKHI